MKVLITGGTGFVGTVFQRILSEKGHTCISFDLHPPMLTPASSSVPHKFIRGDVRDFDALDQAMQGIDAVVHLAAAHHDFGIADSTFYDVNVGGMKNVCDTMQKHGVTRLCFYSTVALYGNQPMPPTEETTPAPETPYGKTKLEAEQVCRQWCVEDAENQCLIIRPTVIFGPNSFANMYSLIRQIDSGKFLRIGKMSNVKSLAYIDNIVSATIELWIDQQVPRQGVECLNYVDLPDLSSWQIVQAVYEGLGRKPSAIALPYGLARALVFPMDAIIALTDKNLPVSSARIRKLALANTQIDASKMHALTKPAKYSVTDGISKMIQWYQAGGKDETAPNRRPPAQI